MRFCYADPPYVGMSWRYPEHPESGQWDDPAQHVALMVGLEERYDGWALSATSASLPLLLGGAPEGTRVAAWVKPFCAYKRNVRVAYAWEPVLFHRSAPRREGEPVGRDYFSHVIELGRGVVGAKPEAFCRWVLTLLGYLPGDELVDLFPGSGVFGRVLTQGVLL